MIPYRYAGVDLYLESHYDVPVWKFLLAIEPTVNERGDLTLMLTADGWKIFEDAGEIAGGSLLDDLLNLLPDKEKARAMAQAIRRSRE